MHKLPFSFSRCAYVLASESALCRRRLPEKCKTQFMAFLVYRKEANVLAHSSLQNACMSRACKLSLDLDCVMIQAPDNIHSRISRATIPNIQITYVWILKYLQLFDVGGPRRILQVVHFPALDICYCFRIPHTLP